MEQVVKSKNFDLEERTLNFAKETRNFIKLLPKNSANFEDSKQLIRSSGSIGANYIEANESLSRKDLLLRLKISLKESKESRYWLNLIDINNQDNLKKEQVPLIQEAKELSCIFASIINKLS